MSGCSSLITHAFQPRGRTITVPSYAVSRTRTSAAHTIAGAARIDITPPPGYPTGGHGPAGAMARGYWTRLYARAFFFADSTASPVVLVSCDFFAVPGGLTATVRRRVSTEWAKRGVSIPPEAIIITATHTHHGPGNYLTAGVYNQYGSRYAGFDKRLFDFLSARITEAIDSAIIDARAGGPATLSIRRGTATQGLLLNRSASTFMSNWNASRIMDRLNPRQVADCRPGVELEESREKDWDLTGCPRLRALDRSITILDVRRSGRTMGMLIFMAVHPIVLEHAAPFNSSDFVGRAVSDIERGTLSSSDRGVVVGFFNGAEGDVVPRRGTRDLLDVERVKDTLLANIVAVLASPAASQLSFTVATREGALKPGSGYRDEAGHLHRLARSPLVGAATFGGSEDDRTILYHVGWREGAREVAGEGQGGKRGALDSQLLPFVRLTRILAPDYAFPAELPIGYVQLGDLKLVTVPAELSTAAGLMLRDSLRLGGRVEIVGLANEYSSYLATADEYEVQDYMGASTIWGPDESSLFTWAATCLATSSASPGCRAIETSAAVVERRDFSPGKEPGKIRGEKTPFGPFAIGEALPAVDDELQRFLRNRTGIPERNLPWFEWTERSRSESDDFMAARRRTVRVQTRVGGSWITRMSRGTSAPDDDGGGNFLTLMKEAPGRTGESRYLRHLSTIWLAPVLEKLPVAGEFRFQVLLSNGANGRSEIVSCPFVVDLSPEIRPSAVKPAASECR